MKRLLTMLVMLAGFAFWLPASVQAQTVPQCTLQTGGEYPSDGHLYVCFANPDGQRLSAIQDAAHRASSADNGLLRTHLTYYYFQTRADAINYMTHTLPFSLHSEFANTKSRCGNTAAGNTMSSWTIATEIYDKCTFDQNTSPAQTILNASTGDTTLHETGHAFDFTWSIFGGGNSNKPISQSVGFKRLVAGPDNGPNNRSDLYTLNLGNANTTAPSTCSVFGTLLPTALEKDLKSPNLAVCNQQQQQINYTGQPNSAISATVAPYFLSASAQPGAGPIYAELFAQEFAFWYNDDGLLLPRINKVLSAGMNCSLGTVARLIGFIGNTGDPVDTTPAPCPPTTEADFRN